MHERTGEKLQREKIIWKAEHNQHGARLQAGKVTVACALVAAAKADS